MEHGSLNVLLIEDDPGDADYLHELLADVPPPGFALVVAECLATGLARLAAGGVDVVLLDLSLPDSQGLATFTTLHTQAPDMPVVILTGLDDEALATHAVQAGAQDYLPKGRLDSLVLVRALRYAIERKRAAQALRRSEERFAKAFQASPDAIAITQMADGRFVDVNASFLRLMGYQYDEVIGRTDITLNRWVDPQERLRLVQLVRAHGAVHDVEAQLRTKTGAVREVSLSIERIDLEAVPCMLTIVRDMTERKQLEAQLRQAQKLEAMGTLASGIAHDFNNILGASLGYTELALDMVPEQSIAWGYLQEVLTAGLRAKELVRQILTFSRQAEQERTPILLQPIVKEALTLLRASLPATIAIDTHMDTETGTVLADPTQVHQILMNLCTNAAHAMQQRGGTLTIRLEAVDVDAPFASRHRGQPGLSIRLTVQDTGHGMAPDVIERIFEPFFTTKARGEGTGLGLAVVYGIVNDHGGILTVASTPGAGTTFAVYFPRHTTVAPAGSQRHEPVPHGVERILFVDDEPALARLGKELLTRLGYDVVIRTSSVEALEAFRAAPQRYNVVITDQTMPQMTGEALARALRRLRPDIPIILCTGSSHALTAEQVQAMGLDAVCMKPLVTRDLGVTIQRVLAQRMVPAPVETSAPGCADALNADDIAVVCTDGGEAEVWEDAAGQPRTLRATLHKLLRV